MSKSSFNALVEAKKQRDGVEAESVMQTDKAAENKPQMKKTRQKSEKNEPPKLKIDSGSNANQSVSQRHVSKRETVRRSYRVEELHDKAIKVMSKFMGQGTEEEIVLNIFAYFFENNTEGKKAIQTVELFRTN